MFQDIARKREADDTDGNCFEAYRMALGTVRFSQLVQFTMFRWRYAELCSPALIGLLLLGVFLGLFANSIAPWMHSDAPICTSESFEELGSDAEELTEQEADQYLVEPSFTFSCSSTRWIPLPLECCTIDVDEALLEFHRQRPPPEWNLLLG